MSHIIQKNQVENGDIVPMCIDDASMFNLQFLQAGLGLSEESTKKWCLRYGLEPVVKARTWWFTGSTGRRGLESTAEKKDAPRKGVR